MKEIDWEELETQLIRKNVTGVKMVLESFAYSLYTKLRTIKSEEVKGETLEHLKLLLQGLDYIYISGEQSPLRDAEYDELHALFNAVTGKHITNKFEKSGKRVKHIYPQLKGTLEKVHYVAESDKPANAIKTHKSLETWLRSALSKLPDKTYNLGFFLKFDGVSVVFALEDGKVISAITRGDSDSGEGLDVTDNFRNIEFSTWVPGVDKPSKCGVKTEVVMKKKDFEKYAKKYKSDTRKLEEPRSAASGLVNADYLPPELLKYLTIVELEYFISGDFMFPLSYLSSSSETKATVIPIDKDFDIEKIRKIIQMKKELIDDYDINCDGVVVRFLDKSAIHKLGRNEEQGVNKFEIAFKFPPEEKETILLGVDFQVGLLGTVTPVAKVAPVKMKGKTISSISLGSIDRMNGLNLHIGDKVTVKYEIIPYLDKKPEESVTEVSPVIQPPTHCPYCGEELEEAPVLMCTNKSCPSRVMGKINNYCVKMNIKGIGPAIIEDFFNAGLLTCIEDLYRLEDKGAAIVELEGYGQKKFKTIVKSIRKNNEIDPGTLLGSLGVKSVGRSKFSKILSIYYIDDLMAMTEKDIPKLCEVPGVQESTAIKVIEGLRENKETIEFLLTKVKLVKKKEGEYNIVFTGVRNREFERHLENMGYEIKDSVNKNTRYLIVDSLSSSTGKSKKADELGVPKLPITEAYKVFGFLMED